MTEVTGLFKKSPALFSGKYIEYRTPMKLFKQLDEEFHFDLDPCTTKDNPLGTKWFFTKEDDGLKKPWSMYIGVRSVFVNPPYGKDIGKWVEKSYLTSSVNGLTVVMLLPVRTDTRWFHEYVYRKPNVEIRFISGRLKFEGDYGHNTAPFPSMLVIFR